MSKILFQGGPVGMSTVPMADMYPPFDLAINKQQVAAFGEQAARRAVCLVTSRTFEHPELGFCFVPLAGMSAWEPRPPLLALVCFRASAFRCIEAAGVLRIARQS